MRTIFLLGAMAFVSLAILVIAGATIFARQFTQAEEAR